MNKHIFLILCIYLLSGELLVSQSMQKGPLNLGPNVNSAASELCPVISPDGKTLYFLRSGHPENVGYAKAQDDQDIWYSELQRDGTWGKAKNIGAPLNNEYPNALLGITSDNTQAIVLGYYQNGVPVKKGFSRTEKTRDGWGIPEGIDIERYEESIAGKTVTASLSTDGRTLLLSFSRRVGEDNDDLLMSHAISDASSASRRISSKWSRPTPLTGINTEFNEITPFLGADGTTLYFASDRNDAGHYKTYSTKRLDDTWEKWSVPEIMGNEINGKDGTGFFSVPASGQHAYFVAVETSNSDIYQLFLSVAVQDPTVIMSGRILNEKTKMPVDVEVIIEELPHTYGSLIDTIRADPQTGRYTVLLHRGKKYGVRPKEQKGFWSGSQYFDLIDIPNYKEYEKDLFIIPLEEGYTATLSNVNFDFGNDRLGKESVPELDRLAQVLTENPKMRIEIGGHTDNVGSYAINIIVSKRRAETVKKYLVSKGIQASRLQLQAYAFRSPVASNATEEGRRANRRVEFAILSS